MKPVVEGWSLILVGDWNSKIITAPWAKAHLARSADSEVTVVMPNLPTLPPRLLLDDIFLVVIDRHLVINPRRADDQLLEAARTMAIAILTELPHTPLVSLGVNFQFRGRADGTLARALCPTDAEALGRAGLRLKATDIRRCFELDNEVLNITLESAAEGPLVSVNHHFDAADAQTARAHLARDLMQVKARTIAMLEQVYGFAL